MVIGEFNDTYPPELDGVGTVVKNYALELSNMGDECYYVAPNDPNYDKEQPFKTLLYRGVKLLPDEPYHVGIPLIDFGYLAKENRIKFDIVHAHSPFAAGMEAQRIARFLKIPIVATFHSKYYDDFYGKTHSEVIATVGTKLVVNFFNQCDEVWAVNEKTAEVLHDYGYKRDILIMPNGTNLYTPDPARVAEISREYGLGDGPVFVFVGQMNWKKNIRKTIEAVALYKKEAPCRMFMIGQGPNEEEIRALSHELDLDDTVIFTGHISDRDRLMSILARADLMIFPSQYDNAPMVVREAAAVGTPAVLLRGSCAAENIRDGGNGLLCEDSAESIADAMKRGLAHKETIGAEARKTIPIAWRPIVAKARERYQYLIDMKN